MDRWLHRALEAEEQLESARERIDDLEGKLKSAFNAEPTSASRALSWIGRAQNAERLLVQIVRDYGAELLPSLRTQIEAQLHTVEILRRDQEALGESPPSEEWWESWRDSDQRSFLRTTREPPD